LKDLRISNVSGLPDENSGERPFIIAAVFFDANCHESISAILLNKKVEIYKRATGTRDFLRDYN
jgi:hypothetical protein